MHYLHNENKGADQLRSDCATALVSHMQIAGVSH